jgi:hypothetical protein
MRKALCLAALVLAGCSEPKPLEMATTPEASRATLTAALDAWKAGASQADLSRRSPPVYFVDDDLERGRKLVDYQIEGEPRPVGTGLSYVVTLTVQDGTKAPVIRRLAYRVVTKPNQSVSREEGTP